MTAPRWMPGVTVISSSNDGGSMTGTDAYFTWHTYETDYSLSAEDGARSLIRAGNEVHFCFNPVTGGLVQILPADRAGRGLVNLDGGVQTNRQGRVNLQVEVIGRASRPWTQDVTTAGRKSLARLVDFADQWGVPRTHPNGDQGPATSSSPTNRSVTGWNGPGGHFCHAQVPENVHWDHGAVKVSDLWAIADAINNPAPEEELMALTVENPLTHVQWPADRALWSIWDAALRGARDAAAALEIAKTLAASPNVSLTEEEIQAAAQKGAQAAIDAEITSATVNLNVTQPGA